MFVVTGIWKGVCPYGSGYCLAEKIQLQFVEMKFQTSPLEFVQSTDFPKCRVQIHRRIHQNLHRTFSDKESLVRRNLITDKIKNAGREISVLNLFAYTGGATVAAAAAGAKVCHVDAARGMVAWAKDNAKSSGLESAPIRYIVDDCVKFCERELKRGHFYDAIIMDPPSYGRGPSGEVWKIEQNLWPLLTLTAKLLSDRPLFVIINSYTTGLSPSVLTYMANSTFGARFKGRTESEELGLPVTVSGQVLPAGAAGR